VSEKLNPLWDEFILWLSVPVEKRGSVASEDDWARSKGYTDARQMRRWKKDAKFVARQRELLGDDAPVVTTVTSGDVLSGDEADYLVVKSQLLESAKNGNLKATELFMKLYGRSWIEEEVASRAADFTNLDLDALVAEGLVAVSSEAVAGELRQRGWQVVPPAGDIGASGSRV
jgi:hypothetical protein